MVAPTFDPAWFMMTQNFSVLLVAAMWSFDAAQVAIACLPSEEGHTRDENPGLEGPTTIEATFPNKKSSQSQR